MVKVRTEILTNAFNCIFSLHPKFHFYAFIHVVHCYLDLNGSYCLIQFQSSDIPIPALLFSLKELAANRPLSEIRTAEEASLVAASMNTDASSLEGELRPDGVEQPSKPASTGLTEAEELEKYLAVREDLYKKAKEFESKIINFETAIRRPYFHVRPLDDPELENWHNYLDFIEKEDDINKVCW